MSKQTDQRAADRALRKAVRASKLLADAARLMREAAAGTSTTPDGHYYLHWASQIEELLSYDHGEAGIGPALQKIAERATRPEMKTYEHHRADGTIVRVTIPENE